MQFKLDENFGRSIQKVFQQAGHDARTVREENLKGAPDPEIFAAAQTERWILITMDHDFGNVLTYRHEDSAGVAVINPPGRPTLPLLRLLTLTLLQGLKKGNITGRLWIVEPGRIREHEPETLD
jgi:hypothetical protein